MYKKITLSWIIEFGPVLVFFFAFEFMRFIPATALFVAVTTASLVASYVKEHRIAIFPLVAGGAVIIFGGATILMDDPQYLIFKDTIYNGLFAVVLLYGMIVGHLPLKRLFQTLFYISDEGWRVLSLRWFLFFMLLTVGNELVWRNFSNEIWVHYKVITTLVTIIFSVLQIMYAKRMRLPGSTKWGMRAH